MKHWAMGAAPGQHGGLFNIVLNIVTYIQMFSHHHFLTHLQSSHSLYCSHHVLENSVFVQVDFYYDFLHVWVDIILKKNFKRCDCGAAIASSPDEGCVYLSLSFWAFKIFHTQREDLSCFAHSPFNSKQCGMFCVCEKLQVTVSLLNTGRV